MKVTRVSVETDCTEAGWEPVQIDGIPEGFSWKMPDVEIGGVNHIGDYVAFIPLAEVERQPFKVVASTIEGLLAKYNAIKK